MIPSLLRSIKQGYCPYCDNEVFPVLIKRVIVEENRETEILDGETIEASLCANCLSMHLKRGETDGVIEEE